MNRKLGSVVSTVALLAVAAGAAAVNVKILHSNQTESSVLNVQEAADVTPLTDPTTAPSATTSADPTVTSSPTATATTDPQPTQTPTVEATQPAKPKPRTGAGNQLGAVGGGKQALGSVGGGAGDDDGEDGEEGDDDGEDGEHGPRGGFVPLTPAQMSLLRVAAIAQVSPMAARDAAKGVGSSAVISRVKAAAGQVGVSLADLAAITDLPPKGGRGHGSHDEQHEGDDDD